MKRFGYIVFLLVLVPCLIWAQPGRGHAPVPMPSSTMPEQHIAFTDTVKTLKNTTKSDAKVKEVAKAKKQPKPEKVDETTGQAQAKPAEKPKRNKRPDGMERPPEIPRRPDN